MNDVKIWLPLLLTFLAGISTGLGSLVALFIKDMKKSYLQFFLGVSAGVMVYVSFTELLASSIVSIGFLKANLAFFGGIILIMIIDFFVPHQYIEEHMCGTHKDKKLMASGVLIALGIAIHNFPEGLAVFTSSLSSIRLGIPLAFAIAIHNIPEGIAITLPIYYATKSKRKAFWYSFFAGIVEPFAAVVGILILMPFLSQAFLSFLLALVAGIMVFISFDELLPLSYEHEDSHLSVVGIIIGMLVVALSLYLL